MFGCRNLLNFRQTTPLFIHHLCFTVPLLGAPARERMSE